MHSYSRVYLALAAQLCNEELCRSYWFLNIEDMEYHGEQLRFADVWQG